jgi:cation:H+ antiporter
MFILWLKFIICAAIVVFCGYRICIYAEKIGQFLKVGRSFIGFILLAIVTSLPELAVTLSATRIGALDLALGDLFGSNLFNLTIVGVILFLYVKKPRQLNFDSTHFITSAFSILLIVLAAVGIVFYNFIIPGIAYSGLLLDVETAFILLIYVFGAFLIFRLEGTGEGPLPQNRSFRKKNILEIWLRFLAFSAILVSAAIYLSHLGDRIAQIPVGGIALGGSFVGSLFIAITTSLPEMAVAISAVRLGFLDMALGNIFGSNMFNMLIIVIVDLFLGRKVVLSTISLMHLFTILFVIFSTALVCASLAYRSRKKIGALAWDSVSIIFIYFAANLVNFLLR